jgi:HEAT repeat protein
VAVAVVVGAGAVLADDAGDVDAGFLETLRAAGVEPNERAICSWLKDLRPKADHQRLAREYVKQLGAEDWKKREQATRSLLSLPAIPAGLLEEATKSDDPEVAGRAREVLQRRGEGVSPILRAAFKVIAARGYRSCLQPALDALPLCSRQHVLQSGADALEALAQPGDIKAIQKAMGSANADVRVALIEPLAALVGEKGSSQLAPWMNKGEPKVRLAAAVAMLNLKNPAGLKGLVDLLDAKQPMVRSQAAGTLRSVTGKYFGYGATGDRQARKTAAAKWARWVREKGASAKLHLPARVGWGCRGDLGGNYLVAYGYKNKVEEVDPRGHVVWSCEVKGAWSAEKLPDGNVLIAAYSENKVVLADKEGKRVWEYGTNCLNVELLPNGNFLVADYGNSRVLEISRDKEVVWSHKTNGSCADAERLANGNTLVAAGNSVREITPEGKVVWDNDLGTQVYSVQHLPGGNVLVSLLSRNVVQEVSREGKVVWKHAVSSPSDAFRLPGGNTLITGNAQAYELTPEGKKLWIRDGLSYGSLRK